MNYPHLGDWVLDLFFPVKCVNCREISNCYICRKCFGLIPIKHGFECIGCKSMAKLGETCRFCLRSYRVDRLLAVADYKNPVVEKALKYMKYDFISDISNPLSLAAFKYLEYLKKRNFDLRELNPVFVPVPLTRKRFNWRGFNQAGILAGKIADGLSLGPVNNCLIRIKDKKHQADIEDREERLENVKGVISFSGNSGGAVKDRNIVLVDDVSTTGATLNECAKVLKEKGAKTVTAFVIARG